MLATLAVSVRSASIADANDTGYNPLISQHFASFSSATYCEDTSKLLDWTCGPCADAQTNLVPGKIRVIDAGVSNASRVLVGKLAGQHGCLMAFRGSDNAQNWMRDMEVWKLHPEPYANCQGCEVHSGFYTVWKNIQDLVLKAVNEVGCGQYSTGAVDNLLYITGHSMGAALTHLAMFSLSDAGWNIAKTYSYEAPRVGNKAFSDKFNERFTRKFPVFRVTHNQDPIVHLPPEALGFYHVPSEVWYPKHGNYTICQGPEDAKCANQFSDIPGMIAFHRSDHCSSPLVPNGDICNPKNC